MIFFKLVFSLYLDITSKAFKTRGKYNILLELSVQKLNINNEQWYVTINYYVTRSLSKVPLTHLQDYYAACD